MKESTIENGKNIRIFEIKPAKFNKDYKHVLLTVRVNIFLISLEYSKAIQNFIPKMLQKLFPKIEKFLKLIRGYSKYYYKAILKFFLKTPKITRYSKNYIKAILKMIENMRITKITNISSFISMLH